MLTTLAISNYRSLNNLVIPLDRLNVITGANGTGKSSLYKALRLLANTAHGALIHDIAMEGGLDKAFWAGPEISRAMKRGEVDVEGTHKQKRQRMRLGFTTSTYGYSVSLGLPPPFIVDYSNPEPPDPTKFDLDPEIKRECIWSTGSFHPNARLVERDNTVIKVRDGRSWQVIQNHVHSSDSLFTQPIDPQQAPEVWQLKQLMQSWRFYDHFRSDAEAPARRPQIGTFTPVLHHDGSNLAAAIQTIIEIGDSEALAQTVDDAFPQASVTVESSDGMFTLLFHQYGLLRPLTAAELSDGTLRYLLWVAALLTPRPPEMMVLNEPETSLHPDLLPALARLIIKASEHSQIWVISHASRLVAALEKEEGCHSICLTKDLGQTQVIDQGLMNTPTRKWADGAV